METSLLPTIGQRQTKRSRLEDFKWIRARLGLRLQLQLRLQLRLRLRLRLRPRLRPRETNNNTACQLDLVGPLLLLLLLCLLLKLMFVGLYLYACGLWFVVPTGLSWLQVACRLAGSQTGIQLTRPVA